MSDKKLYSCDALILGRHIVHGSLSSSYLTGLISRSQRTQTKEENKCTVEIGEFGFSVYFIRKDEGFESDDESSASSLSDKTELKKAWNKKTKDPDDTSSANSSGSEHEEQEQPKHRSSRYDKVKETYPIGDILFCHGTKKYPTSIVFVIRHKAVSRNVQLEALVFQCKNDENMKDLLNAYSDSSRTLKLDRYRQNRRRIGASDIKHSTVTVNNVLVPGVKPLEKLRKIKEQYTPVEPQKKWSLVQHTDRNGVTHIEIEGSCSSRLVLHEESSETDSIISFNTPETDAPLSFITETSDVLSKKSNSSRQRQMNGSEEIGTPPPPNDRKLTHRRCESEGSVKLNHPPQPPPRKHKAPAPIIPKKDKPNTYLVPTKSGTEPKKTLYPKESHVVRGKYVRINVMTNNYSPYGYGMFNSRYVDINDMNNNNNNQNLWSTRGRYWSPSAEMHHTGRRGRDVTPHHDIRRRSRSKSPPRKPMAHRYIDVSIPSLTGFSQKFKELSESVMPKKFRNSSDVTSYTKYMKTEFEDDNDEHADGKFESNIVVISDTSKCKDVKPILKKVTDRNVGKKELTFSKFSTVQMIDPL